MKGKSVYFLYIFFTIFFGLIFLIHLGGSNSWAVDPLILNCDPNITLFYLNPNIVLPTHVPSLERIEITFFGPDEMNPITTSDAFHFYAGEESTDLKENENLVIEKWTLIYTHSSLAENIIYTVEIDANVCTDMKGDFLADDFVMKFVIDGEAEWSEIYKTDPNGLTGDVISSMVVDSQDRLWVGTNTTSREADICYFDGNIWSQNPLPDSPFQINNIPCMAADNQGDIWIGLDIDDHQDDPNVPKAAKLENNIWRIITAKNLNNVSLDEFIKDIAVDSQNNIWIATGGSGVIKYYDDQVIKQFTIECAEQGDEDELSGDFITSLVVDHADVVWIGTAFSGLWKLKIEYDNSYVYEKQIRPLEVFSISAMSSDSDGNIWTGTPGDGILKFYTSTESWAQYTNYSTYNRLPGDDINTLFFDPKKNVIWVGTLDGLGEFDFDENVWTSYTGDNASKDGLSEVAINALAVNSWGQVCFGTDVGLQIKYEAKSPIPTDPPETDNPVVPIDLSGSGCFLNTLKNRTKVWFQNLLKF